MRLPHAAASSDSAPQSRYGSGHSLLPTHFLNVSMKFTLRSLPQVQTSEVQSTLPAECPATLRERCRCSRLRALHGSAAYLLSERIPCRLPEPFCSFKCSCR